MKKKKQPVLPKKLNAFLSEARSHNTILFIKEKTCINNKMHVLGKF